ncbi:trypsin domain-containing protein [Mycolicibacterium mageritense DSM 44476 = CIP 104973]|uniref:Trypsin-like serine protease n=1 Tax=Mycolicibacterium mageritense TaxID=53462 RepID=A0ABM7I550_MYCME|nr:hypothetical protein [Mycolicibacterium mageritense]MCC9184129.1 S1 family peptidase [Mycolicibacterium mageritense]BBX38049.1 hypothetical protein MMAGJ_73310 [Mycolicibacterium mageritense]CDO27215.1 trypsin domain-containing protein [Mycolicibacterium mageritense DSM 44476 = CIP 104973]
MNVKLAVIALVAATAALSACGAPEKPVRVTPAAAASTSAPVRVAAPEWVNVDGQGSYAPFGFTPAPGVRILHTGTDGTQKMCSLGPAVRREGGYGSGFLTAGHCLNDNAPTMMELATDGGGGSVPLAVADRATGSQSWVENTAMDGASIWGPAASPRIAGWPVAGALTVAGVRSLVSVGSPVCFVGATTQRVVCGPAVSVSGSQILFRRSSSEHNGGDSGGPTFLVDNAGRAHLIGIYSGNDAADESRAVPTFLDPQLGRLRAEVMTDSVAAQSVRGDKRWSTAAAS